MADSQLEEELDAKRRIVRDMRALVNSPGWAYFCRVMEAQKATVLLGLTEASSLDDLIKLNANLREAKTYDYLKTAPEEIIAEFEADLGEHSNGE